MADLRNESRELQAQLEELVANILVLLAESQGFVSRFLGGRRIEPTVRRDRARAA